MSIDRSASSPSSSWYSRSCLFTTCLSACRGIGRSSVQAEVGDAGTHPAARLTGAVQLIVGWLLAGMVQKDTAARLNADRNAPAARG